MRSKVTGILYNDEMDDFSLPAEPNAFGIVPSKQNRMEGGKRPQSSMSPVIAYDRDGQVKFAIGAAGGVRIISTVAQVAARVIFMGENLKEATDAPRMYHQLLPYEATYEKCFPKVSLLSDDEYFFNFFILCCCSPPVKHIEPLV